MNYGKKFHSCVASLTNAYALGGYHQ